MLSGCLNTLSLKDYKSQHKRKKMKVDFFRFNHLSLCMMKNTCRRIYFEVEQYILDVNEYFDKFYVVF